ncbi:MAG: Membrane lipoprotein TpN32 precursor [Spirochaetes bacterium ADurb.Bin269]|jgi:D-methionine transport system substrate-binding protein|nr:MAG: Membrane lipoprotein TpN32 precursor [Spirochaetes bacterium ADurb.Bin269]HQL32351.1 MetQ/NlpA family ABC transporter substrate-binding protein [Treponemataceae bacterium]
MKKTISIAVLAAATVCALAVLGGCKKKDPAVLTVGATPEPHAAMLSLVVEDLAKEGITLKVVEFTDYVTPNEAVESGQIDANFFQHVPYMESFNTDKGFHLVSVGGTHVEPLALYSRKHTSIDALPEGATIAIPNDPTNEGRALLLLQSVGLITLDAAAGLTATPINVTANAKKFQFKEIEAASLPRVLEDVDGAVINGNYALPAGLAANKDGILVEGADSPYVNIVTVKAGNEADPRIQALMKALTSDKVREWIKVKYPNGDVVATF